MASLDSMMAAHRAYLLGWNAGAAADSGLVTYRSGVPHAPLNGVLRVSGHDPRDALAEARNRLDGVPWIWWAGPDSDAGTAEALASLGAVTLARMPIMAIDLDRMPSVVPAPPAELLISETTDLEEYVAAYGRVSGIAPAGLATAVEREKGFTGDGTVIRLAGRHADGPIVATAVAWLSHDVLTLYFVGTQPAHRGRGIGTAMSMTALDLARKQGIRTAALTSTPAGEPVYRRIGFHNVATFHLLAFPAAAQPTGHPATIDAT